LIEDPISYFTGFVEESTGVIGWHDGVAVKAADPFHSSAALQKLAHYACFWSAIENDICCGW